MSSLKTRTEAIAAGERTYFTGKVCKNGHIAERYTQSGTCAGCVAASNNRDRRHFRELASVRTLPSGPSADQLQALGQWRDRRVVAFARQHLSDVAAMADYVMWLCVAHWPILSPETFRQTPKARDSAGAFGQYAFYIHPDDLEAFFAEDLRLRQARQGPFRSPFHAELERVAAIQRGERVEPTPDEFNKADDSWPEGDPR